MAAEHQFVELWDERDTHVEELIALTGNYGIDIGPIISRGLMLCNW